jgi:ADP-ribose pyrophosphatase
MSSVNLFEKTQYSRRIYDGKVINLRIDTVKLPNGRITIREVVEHPGAVAIVPFLKPDVILMIRQYRHPTGQVLLEIPAGTLKKGEKPEDCAIRELIEETGYKPSEMRKMLGCYLAPGYSSELIHLYEAKKLVQVKKKPEFDEKIQVMQVDLEKALKMIETSEIKDAKTICGILLALGNFAQ